MDRQPLYSRISDLLANDIASGHYALGSTLPTEPELALQLKVSRSTVRAALAKLEARKMVTRKKNAGTRVESNQAFVGYSTALSTVSDLIQWAQACKRAVQHVERIMLPHDLAKKLACPEGSEWLCIQSLRFDAARGEHPVSWTDAYIDSHYASVLGAIQSKPSALMSALLEKAFGIELTTIEQTVTACKLDAALATKLNAHADEAALEITRRYLNRDQQVVLVTVSTHPSKQFSIQTTLTKT